MTEQRLKPLVVRWRIIRGRVWWQHRLAPERAPWQP